MKTKGLSFFVSLWTAAIVVAGMVADAIYEHAMMPAMTLRALAMEHLGHMLVLGAVIYALFWIVFYILLLRPLNRIYLHLYTIGSGKLETLELDSRVREIRTIVDGVNLMLSRLKLGADGDALELAQRRLAEIRELTRRLAPADLPQTGLLLDKLAELEQCLPKILANGSALPPSTEAPGGCCRGNGGSHCAPAGDSHSKTGHER